MTGVCVHRDSEFQKLASPSRQSRSVHYSHNMFMYMGMPALLLPAEAGRLLLASRAALEPSVRSTEVAGLEHLRRRGGGPEARVVFWDDDGPLQLVENSGGLAKCH